MADNNGNKKSFFKGVSIEFKKIIWPDRDTLIKQTILVVIISLLLGIIISVIDGAAMQLFKLFIA